MLSALERWGGIVVRPRTAVSALRVEHGAQDALWLSLAYLLVAELQPVMEGVASLLALRNVSGLVMLASSLARALLPPILVLILGELLLGRAKSYRRGTCLVPLVVVGALATIARLAGLRIPEPAYLPPAIGIVWSSMIAVRVRVVVVPEEAEVEPAASRRRWNVGVAAGLVLASLITVVGALEVSRVAGRWDRLGPLAPGADLPEFSVALLDGGEITRSQLRGQSTVLVFWATWCGVCKSELPMYQRLHEALSDQAVQVVAVNNEGRGRGPASARDPVTRFRDGNGYSLPFAMDDGTLSRLFRVRMIPHTVLVDASGDVRHVHQGRVTEATLRREIAAMDR